MIKSRSTTTIIIIMIISPCGLQQNLILLIIIRPNVRELSVLRGQEVEHVKGGFPVKSSDKRISFVVKTEENQLDKNNSAATGDFLK